MKKNRFQFCFVVSLWKVIVYERQVNIVVVSLEDIVYERQVNIVVVFVSIRRLSFKEDCFCRRVTFGQ